MKKFTGFKSAVLMAAFMTPPLFAQESSNETSESKSSLSELESIPQLPMKSETKTKSKSESKKTSHTSSNSVSSSKSTMDGATVAVTAETKEGKNDASPTTLASISIDGREDQIASLVERVTQQLKSSNVPEKDINQIVDALNAAIKKETDAHNDRIEVSLNWSSDGEKSASEHADRSTGSRFEKSAARMAEEHKKAAQEKAAKAFADWNQRTQNIPSPIPGTTFQWRPGQPRLTQPGPDGAFPGIDFQQLPGMALINGGQLHLQPDAARELAEKSIDSLATLREEVIQQLEEAHASKESTEQLKKSIEQRINQIRKDAKGIGVELSNDVGPPPKFIIGIQIKTRDDDSEESAVIVDKVREESPAGKAGIQEGDKIDRINGEEVVDFKVLSKAVSEAGEQGNTVKIEITRGDEKKVIEVKPAPIEKIYSRPSGNENQPAAPPAVAYGPNGQALTWSTIVPGSAMTVPPAAGWVIDQKMLSRLKQPDITELQEQMKSMKKDLQEIKELLRKQDNDK